jgi:hypothetical protein
MGFEGSSLQSSRSLGSGSMATVLAFASFDRSVRAVARPFRGLVTRRRAPRARGPSAPSAERAPVSRASDLWRSCRRAGTAPARSSPRRTAGGSLRSSRTRTPRASPLRFRIRETKDAPPEAPRPPWPHSVATAAADLHALARRHGQSGPFDHGITAALRRERGGPAVTRSSSRLLAERPASAVTRRWKACNPVVKDQHPGSASIPRAQFAPRRVGVAVHAASPASTRGAFAAPAFSSGGAFARRASGVPGVLDGAWLCSDNHRR